MPREPRDNALCAVEGDHLTLCWLPDGHCNFYPDTADPVRLAKRLARIIDILGENPDAILCAAGLHLGGEQ